MIKVTTIFLNVHDSSINEVHLDSEGVEFTGDWESLAMYWRRKIDKADSHVAWSNSTFRVWNGGTDYWETGVLAVIMH